MARTVVGTAVCKNCRIRLFQGDNTRDLPIFCDDDIFRQVRFMFLGQTADSDHVGRTNMEAVSKTPACTVVSESGTIAIRTLCSQEFGCFSIFSYPLQRARL